MMPLGRSKSDVSRPTASASESVRPSFSEDFDGEGRGGAGEGGGGDGEGGAGEGGGGEGGGGARAERVLCLSSRRTRTFQTNSLFRRLFGT